MGGTTAISCIASSQQNGLGIGDIGDLNLAAPIPCAGASHGCMSANDNWFSDERNLNQWGRP
jgi:hypothetical protein